MARGEAKKVETRGGARKGAGRKKKPWSGNSTIRIDLDVLADIRETAAEEGESVGGFITKIFAHYERFVRNRVPVPHFNENEKKLPEELQAYFGFDFVSAEYMMLREKVAFGTPANTFGYFPLKTTTILHNGHKIRIEYARAYFIEDGKKVKREIPLRGDEATYEPAFIEDMKSKTAG